jgi:ActR/RegA family two-component response regulator
VVEVVESILININPKPRIILVDDNRYIVTILAGIFGLRGYEVYKTYTAEECIN